MGDWIDVKARLPSSQSSDDTCNEYVLIYIDGYGCSMAMYMNDDWYDSYVSKVEGKVLGWMGIPVFDCYLLPEPPK